MTTLWTVRELVAGKYRFVDDLSGDKPVPRTWLTRENAEEFSKRLRGKTKIEKFKGEG